MASKASKWVRTVGVIAAVSMLSACDSGGSTPTPSPTPSPTPTPPPVNTVPPQAPGKVTLDSFAHNQVKISWTAGTDDIAVVKYAVIRSDKPNDIAVVTGLTYTDDTATPIMAYTYQVVSIDGSDNRSSPSAGVEVTTLPTPTANCPATSLDYPGPGGTGQTVGFQGSDSALKPVGPANLPAGTSWDAATGLLTVSEPNVHLTDVIVRGGIKVVAKGVFTLTNSVVEFQKDGQNLQCFGNQISDISQCRLTGNTFRSAAGIKGGGVKSDDTAITTARCNYIDGMSLSYSEGGSVADYNWVSGGYITGYNSTVTVTHNRAAGLSVDSKYGGSRFSVDGNYFGAGPSTLRTMYLAGALPIFRNNVVTRPTAGGEYCDMSTGWRNSIGEVSNNFVGDLLGNRTAVAFNFPNDCRWFDQQ